MVQPDAGAYLESWAEELGSRANRVRNLIGDAHWLSDGNHKEALLRDFLQRHLPRQLAVANGFVTSPSRMGDCSPEIDILVADPTAHAPLFAESDLYIATPRSVAAHLQVKTSYAKNELMSALANVLASQTIIATHAESARVWRGILFYSVPESRTPTSVIDTLEDCLKQVAKDWRNADIEIIDVLPNCIVALSDWVIFVSPIENGCVNTRLFELERLSAACAVADLFSSIRRWLGGDISGDLDRMIESMPIPAPHVRTIDLARTDAK